MRCHRYCYYQNEFSHNNGQQQMREKNAYMHLSFFIIITTISINVMDRIVLVTLYIYTYTYIHTFKHRILILCHKLLQQCIYQYTLAQIVFLFPRICVIRIHYDYVLSLNHIHELYSWVLILLYMIYYARGDE